MSKILIIDDQRAIRNSLEELLTMNDHSCYKCSSATEGFELLRNKDADLIFCDIMMEGMDGMEFLGLVKSEHPEIPIIMISGHGTIECAVECLKLGAADFITKPLCVNRVMASLNSALSLKALESENKRLRKKIDRAFGSEIIGESPAIKEVLDVIEKISQTSARVLITGENGTGKELAARLIHNSSERKAKPFVEVNCAAIPSELIESELFGHERGSFTGAVKQRKGKFEQAEGGTIFLDEIGDMSLSAQAKVLRALQENKITRVGSDTDISVNVRIIAATNKNLKDEIAAHNFREDLYHRLSVIKLHIPSLNERREDIPLLVRHFLKLVCSDQNRQVCTIDDDALSALAQRNWTGNIRELRNCVERLVILCHSSTNITKADVEKYC